MNQTDATDYRFLCPYDAMGDYSIFEKLNDGKKCDTDVNSSEKE